MDVNETRWALTTTSWNVIPHSLISAGKSQSGILTGKRGVISSEHRWQKNRQGREEASAISSS